MSIFSFSHSVFNPLGELSTIFIKFEIVIGNLFHFASLKFIVWERFKKLFSHVIEPHSVKRGLSTSANSIDSGQLPQTTETCCYFLETEDQPYSFKLIPLVFENQIVESAGVAFVIGAKVRN